MRKLLSMFVVVLMLLSMLPAMAFASEETTLSLSEMDGEISQFSDEGNIEFDEVEAQDVEVYVTDGYEPIAGQQ